MQTKRIISVFSQKDETLVDEIDVSFLELDKLKKIFNPSDED